MITNFYAAIDEAEKFFSNESNNILLDLLTQYARDDMYYRGIEEPEKAKAAEVNMWAIKTIICKRLEAKA